MLITQEAPQLPAPAGVLQLAQRLSLDLPDALARDAELLAHLFKRVSNMPPLPVANPMFELARISKLYMLLIHENSTTGYLSLFVLTAMATPRTQNLRVTRLELRNWRNFRHADIALERRAFFVGPNASGKSNLLDALRFLRDLVAVGGGLEAAVARRGGTSKIRWLNARKKTSIGITVVVGDNDTPEIWSYSLEFSQEKNGNPTIMSEKVYNSRNNILSRPDKEDDLDEQRLRETNLESLKTNEQFRELATFFASIRYLHIVPQLIREPDRSIGIKDDPFGGDFLEKVASTSPRTRDSRLKRILEALRVAVPNLSDLTLERDNKGRWHLKAKYEHWRPQGAWQTEESFSDGTLRLLGLLWSMLEDGGPLLLEEPELSLHPAVVRQIPRMFSRMQRKGGRQVLVTTHSEALLNDKGIGLDEVHLIKPEKEGSSVVPATDLLDVKDLLEGGVPLGEAILPLVQPNQVEQLALFE